MFVFFCVQMFVLPIGLPSVAIRKIFVSICVDDDHLQTIHVSLVHAFECFRKNNIRVSKLGLT